MSTCVWYVLTVFGTFGRLFDMDCNGGGPDTGWLALVVVATGAGFSLVDG